MKKNILAMLLATATIPFVASSIENGKPESLDVLPSLVDINMNCTGTIIAGDWVITAAHCDKDDSVFLGDHIETDGDNRFFVESHNRHPTADVSLWKLKRTPFIDSVLFLSDEYVTNNKIPTYTVYGFGQTDGRLNSALYKVKGDYTITSILYLKPYAVSQTVPGDSGAPIIDKNDSIVSIGTRGDSTGDMSSVRITHVQDFILDTINGWHYPTDVDADINERVVIEIQSLHNHELNAGDADVLVSDNVYLDAAASSCITASSIQPFDKCTYTIVSADGLEGRLDLGSGQIITVNHQDKEPVVPPEPEVDGGSSGGNVGWGVFAALLSLSYLRRRSA